MWLCSAVAAVAEPSPLTLEQLVAEACKNNPEIRALTADIAGARGEVDTAKTWQNPELTVAPGAKHVRGEGSEFHGDFGLQQTIEYPGKRALRRAVAEKNVAVRQTALSGFRYQLAIQVRRAHFTLLTAHEIMALREQRLALAKAFVQAAKKKVEGGFAPEFEATKAEVEIVIAQKALREAQAQHESARVALNSLLGRKPSEPLSITGTPGDGVATPDLSALLSLALARNPSLKVQQTEVERTGLSLRSVKKSRLPDVTVGPSFEYASDEQIYGFGFSLPLPLWDRKKGEIETATAEQEKALAELDKLQREIVRDVAMASQNLFAAKEALTYFTPALREKIKVALDAAAQSYAEGRTTLLIYLEMRRTYFDTQADYLETLQKLYEAQAELEAALGVPLTELQTPTNLQEKKQ